VIYDCNCDCSNAVLLLRFTYCFDVSYAALSDSSRETVTPWGSGAVMRPDSFVDFGAIVRLFT